MSKFIKGFFNKPGQTAKGNEDTTPQNQPQQPVQKTSSDPLDRPFEVDITDLWKYDPEELTDYVHKYEKYTQDLKKMNISLQKELAAVRERLEISEQEKSNLEQQLIKAPGQSKDHDGLVAKHLKIPESLSEAQQESRSPVKLELLIEKHLDSVKLFSFKGQDDIHILTEMARNQLNDILENLKNLHKFPWETIEEHLQSSLLDDLRDDIETEDAERTQISSIGGMNLTAVGDRTDETDHHITFDTEFNKKKTDRALEKNLDPKRKVLKQRLENQLGVEISKSLLLDERRKSDITSFVNKLDQELTKLGEDVIAFTKNAEVLRDQLTKPLVEDLQKIFPATGSGEPDLQKYCQQLEEYVERMKVQIQEGGKTKLKQFEQISKEFDDTKTSMRTELAHYHERLADEKKRNEALALELQSAQADKVETEDHLKRKNDEQAHRLEALEKHFAESKDRENAFLTKLKSFGDNTNKENTFDQIKDEAQKLQDEITKLEEINRKDEQEKLIQQNELKQERSKSENLKSEFGKAESNIRDLKKKYDESCQKLAELEKEHYKASIRLKAFEKSSSFSSHTSTKSAEGEIKETDNISASVQNKENLSRNKFPESIIRLEKRINETIVALDEYLHGIPN